MNVRLVLLFVLSFVNTPELTAAERNTVILLSFDGARPDYFSDQKSPHVMSVGRMGWHGTLTSIFPTESFPNHATLISGCDTSQHGIVSNKFVDPTRGPFEYLMDPSWMDCEPVWFTAETKGIKTAITYWPLHGQGSWKQKNPTYQNTFSTHDIRDIIRFDDADKIKQILSWLRLPEEKRPRLILSWFADIDTAGHAYGPDSPEVVTAVREYDQLLGILLEALQSDSHDDPFNLMIVSDHGMAEMKYAINVEALRKGLVEKGVNETVVKASGTNAIVYFNKISGAQKKGVVKWLSDIGHKTGSFDLYERNQIPRRWHFTHA